MPETIWICGRMDPALQCGWEVVGAYDSEQKAIDACKDATFFIGPQVMNQTNPEAPTSWPGCYYPLFVDEEATT